MPGSQLYEREYEFAFNSEFVERHRRSISAPAFLPGGYAESLLGFDVEHRLSRGVVQHSIFLQFKVPYPFETKGPAEP
jgi:hypothetical protein